MTKRIVCLVLSVIMLSALFVLDVSAADKVGVIYEQTFTKPAGAGADWKPDGWNITGRHGGSDYSGGTYRVTDEGYVELCRGTYGGTGVGSASMWYDCTSLGLPSKFTYMFDVNVRSTGGGTTDIYCYMGIGGFLLDFGFTDQTIGAWYRYCVQMDGNSAKIYRQQLTDESGNAIPGGFTLFKSKSNLSSRVNEFFIYSGQKDSTVWVDNVKIMAGTALASSDLSVTNTAISADIKVQSVVVAPTPGAQSTIAPILVVFDKKGKILDMVNSSSILVFEADNSGDKNHYTITKPIDSTFYSKMQGGTVELYLLESITGFNALADPYVQTVQ